MKNMINKYQAIEAAVNGIGLRAETARVISLEREGDCYELILKTDWVMYTCYVDLSTGKLVGLDTEPFVDVEAVEGLFCDELLRDIELTTDKQCGAA